MSDPAFGPEPSEWEDSSDATIDLAAEYDVQGELGRGGSAIVYRAVDRVLGRPVAIKVVHPRHTVDDEALARLAREARMVASLQHPNIVTVHAVKRLSDGGLALVMQLVPGRTLKELIAERGSLSPEQTERVLRDVAGALAYAHARGIVHRDVKPENIFVDDATGRALLSDFGIAHSNEFDARLTMTGTAIGTPAYMSPEQIDGAAANSRSDVYSLGLVAWEMLTGRRPWDGESLYSVIYHQKHDELPPLDTVRTGVPLRLQYIIERMLQKKAAARWAGAEGLLAHLDASVLPPDWTQWQDARRRRRTISREAQGARGGAHAARGAMATIRFRRGPITPPGALPVVPSPGDAAPANADGAAAADVDDRPTWATAAAPVPGTRRRALGALLVLVVLGTAGGGALYWRAVQARDVASRNRSVTSTANLNDRGAIAVSVAPTSDSNPRSSPTGSARPLAQESPNPSETAVRDIDAVGRDARVRDSVGRAWLPARPPSQSPAPTPAAARGAVAPFTVAASSAGSLAPAPAARTAVTPPDAAPRSVALPAPTVPPLEPEAGSTVRSTDDRSIVAAGGRHSCVIGPTLLCWGANDRGQLGNGELESRETPLAVAGDLDFVQVSSGLGHTCGVTRRGDGFCWGADESGQLGDATTTSRSAPVRVATNVDLRLIRAGRAHSCALTTDSTILCWGANDAGQLGDGGGSSRSKPVAIASTQRFIAVAAGGAHSCAITTEGAAVCWGENADGQLGDGTHTARRTPVPVSGDVRFTSIAAGLSHTCAIAETGEAYCWGRNSAGQLGVGGSAPRPVPTRVAGTNRFASITAGTVHTCARMRSGAAMCWGRNTYGQLGDGTTIDRDTPARVAGPAAFAALNASGAHTCGVVGEADAWCWGYNVDGQLGDGTRAHHPRPARVPLPASSK